MCDALFLLPGVPPLLPRAWQRLAAAPKHPCGWREEDKLLRHSFGASQFVPWGGTQRSTPKKGPGAGLAAVPHPQGAGWEEAAAVPGEQVCQNFKGIWTNSDKEMII